VLSIIR